jgi:tetratricopeptide (TPR) repeat protein
VSATAFADDLQRYLRHEPIGARRDTIAYRAAKFVRRHRVAVATAALIVATLAGATYVANRERAIAERRFVQVRQLANKLFDIDVEVRQLPGSARPRRLIVNTALDYLQRLTVDAGTDPDLALEVGTAYMRVARVQGVPISANLGQSDEAERNLRKAEALVLSVHRSQPLNRTAVLRLAQMAHDRMILAGDRRPDTDALPLARQAAERIDEYLASGPLPTDPDEAQQVAIVINNVSNRFRIAEQYDEALRFSGRGLEIARRAAPLHVGAILNMRSLVHREQGQLDAALADVTEAAKILDPGEKWRHEVGRTNSFALALMREGSILGDIHGISLGRPSEALAPLERAFTLSDAFVHQDPNDSDTRGRLGTAGLSWGQLLTPSDPAHALAIFDHVLGHLAEIQNNPRFRRDEARTLAASTYPLRALGRTAEARQRLDAAFARLAPLKLYPAKEIKLASEADDAVRARADIEAAVGDVARAMQIDEELLDAIQASKPRPEQSLADATALSHLYMSLSALHQQNGHADRQAEFDRRRHELWQGWAARLPGNSFVRRQLADRP